MITNYNEYICCLQQRRDYNKMIYSLRSNSPILAELKAKSSILEELILKYEVGLRDDREALSYHPISKEKA